MKQRNALLRVLTHWPTMALLAWSCGNTPAGGQNLPGPLAQFCGTDTTAGAGNLDRPASVVIAVQKDKDGNPTDAYAVNVNPDIRQARAVDLKAGNMVPAPNIYFPMAVRLGAFTEDLAISDDGKVAVALDAADRTLRFFRVGPAPKNSDTSPNDNWKRFGDDVAVDMRPTGLAVRGGSGDLTVAVSHAGDPTGSVTILRWAEGSVSSKTRINLGGRPSGVGITEDRAWIVVSNATSNNAYLVPDDADPTIEPPLPACDETRRACFIDTGTPTNDVTVGSQPSIPGGQRYPVALFTHVEEPRVSVVRLRTAGNTDTAPLAVERVEAAVTFPSSPVAVALAPEGAPICCRGGPFGSDVAALASGGFAYAVVAVADGRVIYLDLNAKDDAGNRGPRLIDTNSAGPEVPAEDGVVYEEPGLTPELSLTSPVRPTVRTEPRALAAPGAIPVVDQGVDATYTLTWEGVIGTLGERRGHVTQLLLQQGLIEDAAAGVDFAGLGVRPGDVVEIPAQTGCECPATDAGACDVFARLPVVQAAGSTIRVEGSFDVRDCLLPPPAEESFFTFRIRAGQAFDVRRDDGLPMGRVRFYEPLDVPGLRIRVLPAGFTGAIPDVPVEHGGDGNGPVSPLPIVAPPTGSTLRVTLRSNFKPFQLDLDDVDYNQLRFLPGNSTPTGISTAIAPVYTGTGATASVITKAIGVMSVAGGGLLLQFDLGVHPNATDGRIVRGSTDTSYKVFE